MTGVEIKSVRFGAPVAQRLIAAAMADLGERYGGTGDDSPIEPGDFDPPGGSFFVAVLDGQPVGCGGWRSHGDLGDVAEVKRLYVAPGARRTGVARALMAAIEASVREGGRRRIILECGQKQPEAIRLYESSGYQRIENFGYYRDAPLCVSFGRDI